MWPTFLQSNHLILSELASNSNWFFHFKSIFLHSRLAVTRSRIWSKKPNGRKSASILQSKCRGVSEFQCLDVHCSLIATVVCARCFHKISEKATVLESPDVSFYRLYGPWNQRPLLPPPCKADRMREAQEHVGFWMNTRTVREEAAEENWAKSFGLNSFQVELPHCLTQRSRMKTQCPIL